MGGRKNMVEFSKEEEYVICKENSSFCNYKKWKLDTLYPAYTFLRESAI